MAGQDGSVGSATGLDVLRVVQCQETSTETPKIQLFFESAVKTNLPLITYKWLYIIIPYMGSELTYNR